ncbi:MAG TPA: hypothetical protein PLC54_02090 [Spirochaetales bacterium]|nr:hypothetical protein [Spirochaetales bacterium]
MTAELVAAAATAFAWNALSASAPGFPGLAFLPYWLPAVVFASFYGPWIAYASIGLSLLAIAGLSILTAGDFSAFPIHELVSPSAALVLAAISALGFGSIARKDGFASLLQRYRAAYKDKLRLGRTLEAVKIVNAYYEKELLSAQDALPLLHEHLRGLNTRSVSELASGLLALANRFASLRSGAVYRYDERADQLELVARYGDSPAPASRPLEGSVEGWAFRNASRFTLRQVLEDPYLAKMDDGRVVLALPLGPAEHSWGVFVALDMPFVAYTESNERALSAILELARPYLERAVRFERLARESDFDAHSGIPSYGQFSALLADAFSRETPFSLILCQIDNLRSMIQELGPAAERACVSSLSSVFSGTDAAIELCQYKRSDQIAILIPGLREDGVSRMSLEALAALQSQPPVIADREVRLDLRIGFASRRAADQSSEDMTGRAELLIEMQA